MQGDELGLDLGWFRTREELDAEAVEAGEAGGHRLVGAAVVGVELGLEAVELGALELAAGAGDERVEALVGAG